MLMQQTQRRKRTRIDDVFDVIARYAETYPGSTPSQKQIAEELGLSQQRISYLLMRLEALGRIKYLDGKNSYYVPRSEWEPPPDVV